MGFTDADLARIHGPIGLAIGAVSPAEIAVSILAQMTQVLRRGEKAEAAMSGIAVTPGRLRTDPANTGLSTPTRRWTFATYSRKGKGRSAEAHYDCMSLADIKALPVAEWAAPDCVLLLWVTDPLLDKAMDVIRAWGFTYKTVGFCWAKLNKSAPASPGERDFFTGLGFWTRANPELCLLATSRPSAAPQPRRAQS